jgi:hypothetical protein
LNVNSRFDARIFSGAIYNSNKISLYVQIYDNDGAYTVFHIPQSVVIYQDETDLILNMNKLISIDPKFESNIVLNGGSFMGNFHEIQMISSLLNNPSLSDKMGLIMTGMQLLIPQVYGPLANFSGVIPVNF